MQQMVTVVTVAMDRAKHGPRQPSSQLNQVLLIAANANGTGGHMIRNIGKCALAVLALGALCSCASSTPRSRRTACTEPIAWGAYGGAFGRGDGEFHQPGGVAFDSRSNMYVADVYNRRIQVFGPDGSYLRQWAIAGIFESLAIDGNDDVYVPFWDGYVIKYDRIGNEILRWGSQGDTPGKFESPTGIAINRNERRIYVVDVNGSNIQVFDDGGRFLDRWGDVQADGIALDADGHVWITSRGDVRVLSGTGEPLVTWKHAEPGREGFQYASCIGVDSDGNVFVSDPRASLIYKFSPTGEHLTHWGGFGSEIGKFCGPSHIAIAKDNCIYVSDSQPCHRVQKFDSDGKFIRVFGKAPPPCDMLLWPSSIAIGDDGAVHVVDIDYVKTYDVSGNLLSCCGGLGYDLGKLFRAQGVAARGGHVYVTDSVNARIQVFNEQGAVERSWGHRGIAEGEFYSPIGIAVDDKGMVYVVDGGMPRVQLFEPDGTFLKAFKVPGGCHGVAVDDSGGVYVTLRSSHTVQKYDHDGHKVLEWGGEGAGEGEFDNPTGICIGSDGSIYVADFENSRIQKFDGAGAFLGTWGVSGSKVGELYRPQGVACWGDFVFVGDSNNARVQRVPKSCWDRRVEIDEW